MTGIAPLRRGKPVASIAAYSPSALKRPNASGIANAFREQVDETRLADILADEYRLSRVSRFRSRTVDLAALSYLSYKDAMKWSMLPYAVDPDNGIYVAISDPSVQDGIDFMRENCHGQVIFQVAERSEIEASIQRYYPLALQLPKTMKGSCVDA